MRRLYAFFFVLAFLFASARPGLADDFRCEVLNLKGTVTVHGDDGASHPAKQSEQLKAGDEIEVGDDSYIDLAYDKDWKNITRLEANSKVKVTSIAPGKLTIEQGGVFAKLKKLPKDSSFDVTTPTAVATVRGSEYRTTFIFGQTDVFNAASSRVVVYGVKEDGTPDKDTAVMIEKDKKTSVQAAGKAPVPAAPMSESEIKAGQSLQKGIETNVRQAEKEGRTSTLQSVADIEKFIREEKKKSAAVLPVKPDELSRVTDTRRRPFGGDREMAPPPREEESKQAEPAPPAKKEEPAPDKNA